MAEFYTKKKGISFQEIIWKTLEALREKASQEYRKPQKKILIHSNWSETVMEGDSRNEFIQLVQFLTDILYQEFENETLEKYNQINEEIKVKRDLVNSEKLGMEEYTIFKLEKMREQLRLMMVLIKKTDYLKSLGDTSVEESEDE